MELKQYSQLQNGKYTILKKIGEGGFGITYKGIWKMEVPNPLGKTIIDYPVAIKEFFFQEYCSRDESTGNVTISSAQGRELFLSFKEKLKKEGDILLKLNHPHIVHVSEVFEENNTAYIVMEFIDGENLKDIIDRKGRLDKDIALCYIKTIVLALQYIHDYNIIHLDIKPANIIIDKSGQAKLIDFGIAKQYTDSNPYTQAATVTMFSKGYSPLEQYATNRKERYSARTDIYALGATFYHCITGEVPIEAAVRLSETLLPPSRFNTEIPSFIEKAILKAMALKDTERYSSMTEFWEALEKSENYLCEDKNQSNPIIANESKLKRIHKEYDTQYLNDDISVSNSFTAVESNPETNPKSNSENHKAVSKKQKTEKSKFIYYIFVSVLTISVIALFIFNHYEKSNRGKIYLKNDSEITNTLLDTLQKIQQDSSLQEKPSVKSDSIASKQTAQPVMVQPTELKTITTIDIDGNKYTGETKKGKPNGNGKIVYTGNNLISPYDTKKTIAEDSDYLLGKWKDGDLEYGTLYNKNGTKKMVIIIGQ